ncbi:MAG: TetR/AcrR family transcriptional regulator [Acidimicrobiales bacterium]|nr:TetR/AcrR family transcriptional regulator [Acidimicrobiales bacterium]
MSDPSSEPTDPSPGRGAAVGRGEAADRVDGRRQRRERGRIAVIDAMVDLIVADGGLPDVATVAERAGVSVSSVYRYFDNLDTLRLDTISRTRERYADLFILPGIGQGDRHERVTGLVRTRARLYATIAPVARLVRARSGEHRELADVLNVVRQEQVAQVQAHFAHELDGIDRIDVDDVVTSIVVATSFEAWDLYVALGREPLQIRRAWTAAVDRLLG